MNHSAFEKSQLTTYIRSLCLISVLLSVPVTTHADYFIDGEGKEQPFCEAILAALNKSKPTDEHRPCISEEILKLPGVTDPTWEKLDLSQHEELAMEMMTLGMVGSTEYFREKKLAPNMYPTSEGKRRMLEFAKQGGAELFALRLAPKLFDDRVLMTLRYQAPRCGIPYDLRGEEYHPVWVTSDLKKIATGPGLFDSWVGRPLMHRGRLYLMRTLGSAQDLEIYVPRRMYLSKICSITFTSANNFAGRRN
jgi:hypothetical protein